MDVFIHKWGRCLLFLSLLICFNSNEVYSCEETQAQLGIGISGVVDLGSDKYLVVRPNNDATKTVTITASGNCYCNAHDHGCCHKGTTSADWAWHFTISRTDSVGTQGSDPQNSQTLTWNITSSTALKEYKFKVTKKDELYDNCSTMTNTEESKEITVIVSMFDNITFEPVGDNANLSDNKDPDGVWMPGKGKKIFPDAKDKDDETARNEVYVKVKGAHEGTKIYLKVIDVDDPTPDTTNVIDNNDEDGEVGDDNRDTAFFTAGNTTQIECTADSEGVAKIDGELPKLSVGMQPGDNYRVAACLDADAFGVLQVTDSDGDGYVASGDGVVDGFDGAVSPMLTVWRKLHIEVDTMQKWQGDKPSPDRVMATGVSWVKNNPGGMSVLTLSGLPSVPDNFYLGGFIKSGNLQYDIISNTGNTIKIFHGSNIPSDEQYDAFIGSVEVHDDDDRSSGNSMLDGSDVLALYSHGALINDWVKKRFTPAYIELEEIPHNSSNNSNSTVPFEINSSLNVFTALNNHQDMSGEDREAYWYHFVVAAYQYTSSQDEDPNGEGTLLGGTTGNILLPKISAIFTEEIRDNYYNIRNDSNYLSSINTKIDHVTAHEIAHSPGNGPDADHAEQGLMGDNASEDDFKPATIERLRSTEKWQP